MRHYHYPDNSLGIHKYILSKLMTLHLNFNIAIIFWDGGIGRPFKKLLCIRDVASYMRVEEQDMVV